MTFESLSIRETTSDDISDIVQVERLAFGQDDEANLVTDLLHDETAKPTLSLLAFIEGKPVGHILFSRVFFKESENQPLMHILAPMAVLPAYQGKGIGGKLIKKGLEILRSRGGELVFVLGHEKYYPKHGFIPNAGKFGLKPPYPISEDHVNAWMFRFLNKENQKDFKGSVKCAKQLDKPEYWVE